MVKTSYEQLEARAYDCKSSEEQKEEARLQLALLFPEQALGIFARRRDMVGLEYISRNPEVDIQLRRNAYLERGIQCEVEDIRAGVPLEYRNFPGLGARKPRIEDPLEKKKRLAAEQMQLEIRERELKIARQFRAEFGISENEYYNWLSKTRRSDFAPRAHVNRFGEEMSPGQENALRALEDLE